MTRLTVTPIDLDAPGSHGLRKRILQAVAQIQQAQVEMRIQPLLDAYVALEQLIGDRLLIQDGAPVAELLDRLSANEFDQLIAGLLGGPAIPPANGASSRSGPTGMAPHQVG